MKLVILCLFGSALAELPRLRPARFRFQRQELAPTTDSSTEATTETAPYPPSGWKPSGQAFTLPEQTEATTTDSAPYPPSGWKPSGQAFTLPEQTEATTTDSAPYPPSGWKPDQPFALPNELSTSYGTPENTYGAPVEGTTDNPKAEKLDSVEVQKSVGTYFIVLPNGQLQRVEFLTENDLQNMKYTARLQLRDRAPLYIFGP
ncbi:uncharacterized protein LOC126974486 isoform X2 [Leptidea sinapis]|uniref:uncharacterized protein LOC126974486 isoform X1 n=1 Tax=Leptidea sinapis TaxID=189913 RepID=UPI0021C29097|nr:uncharacterized protein LOC126974486 isoform X1 [Leptidea sinapis]XP_050677958.1 uncharacterized protein LOC126974486 isoform X2 [Leptidea sinapis]